MSTLEPFPQSPPADRRPARRGALDYGRMAAIYDHYARYEDDLPFWVEVARAHPGRLLELMAGTGRVSLSLLAAGLDPLCVDIYPQMLAVLGAKARARGVAPRLCCGDVRDLPLAPGFDLALLPFQGFSELISGEDQQRALASVHRILRPGGRLVLTLHNPKMRLAGVTGEWVEAARFPRPNDDGEVVVSLRAVFDPKTRTVRGHQRIERHDRGGALTDQTTLALAFSLPGRDELEELAAAAGFEPIDLAGDYEGSPYREAESPIMVWTLQRAATMGAGHPTRG